MVLFDGISFIPKIGIQTQKIPPITSVNESNVSSAAGINFEPIEYSINPKHTIVPCNENKASFLLDERIGWSLIVMIINETTAQNIPAIATVVNFGVSFLHLKLTENTENPKAEAKPNNRPSIVFFPVASNAIIDMPRVAITIATQTLKDTSSFKNKKPNKAVIKGIAARHNKVTAAVVLVIDHIKVIIAVPNPIPPIIPERPIFK